MGSAMCTRPEEVIDRVTERLIERLRSELRGQVEAEAWAVQTSREQRAQRMEAFLADEIESHTCAICYELMVAPVHSPTILVPCGHTLCAACMKTYTKGMRRAACPVCKADISSQAVNWPLQQLIQNFVAQRQKLDRSRATRTPPAPRQGVVAGQGGSAPGAAEGAGEDAEARGDDEEARLLRDYSMKSMRYRVLKNELDDTQVEAAQLDKKVQEQQAVLSTMEQSEWQLQLQLEDLQAQLHQVQAEKVHQESHIADLLQRHHSAQQRNVLVQDTLSSLAAELEKIQLLISGLRELQLPTHPEHAPPPAPTSSTLTP